MRALPSVLMRMGMILKVKVEKLKKIVHYYNKKCRKLKSKGDDEEDNS